MIKLYCPNMVFDPESLQCGFGLETATIIAIAGAASAAAGTGFAIASANDAADQQKKSAAYNAAVAEANAAAEKEKTQFETDRIRDRNRRLLSTQRAAFARNGLLFSGSALDVQRDSAVQGELDALNARYGGTLRQQSFQSQAQLDRYAGSRVNRGLMIGGAAASGLSGVATASSSLPSFNG